MRSIGAVLCFLTLCSCASVDSQKVQVSSVLPDTYDSFQVTDPAAIYKVVSSSFGAAAMRYTEYAMVFGAPKIQRLDVKLNRALKIGLNREVCAVDIAMVPGDGSNPIHTSFETPLADGENYECKTWKANLGL